MFRIAVCFMLLAGTVTNALADDDVSTGISNKQTLPKSYVIELTRLVMKDSASNFVAGLSGSRLRFVNGGNQIKSRRTRAFR
jgi:hypothetical protein